jgi:sugar phosphate isomerase/epimerase
MRLGAPIFSDTSDPQAWVEAHHRLGYSAAYCPNLTNDEQISAFAEAAHRADLLIAEVGSWSNPLSPDLAERSRAIVLCQERLALADEVGARCCVNIAGSRGPKWDGPDPADLSADTFEMIVETTRVIIDAVKPRRSFYTLETMPWMYPDSLESYERLLKAIDRPAFGVHYDPVNLINSPERFFHNAHYTQEFVHRLGARIRSVHIKDIRLDQRLTVHLDEAIPGQGGLDIQVLLRELEQVSPDLPVMCEHLPSAADYAQAVAHIRQVAQDANIQIKAI